MILTHNRHNSFSVKPQRLCYEQEPAEGTFTSSRGFEALPSVETPLPEAAHAERAMLITKVATGVSDVMRGVEEEDRAEELHATLQELLANTPATLVVSVLKRDPALFAEVRETLVPYAMQALNEYARTVAPSDCPTPSSILNAEEQLYMALLHSKDPFTAEHCVDVLVGAHRLLKHPTLAAEIDQEQAAIFLRASLMHDCGKCQLPNIALLNPVPREMMPQIYADFVASNEREGVVTVPAKLVGKLTEEQQALFDGTGEFRDEDRTRLAAELAELCDKNRVDMRQEIPMHALLKATHALAESGTATGMTAQILEDQLPALRQFEQIARLNHIDPNLSFKDWLDLHEAGGVAIVAAANNLVERVGEAESLDELPPEVAQALRVVQTIARHHNNPITRTMTAETPALNRIAPPERDSVLHALITIVDIIAALNQKRPYFAGQQRKAPPMIRKIMGFTVKDGETDALLTSLALDTLMRFNSAEAVVEDERVVIKLAMPVTPHDVVGTAQIRLVDDVINIELPVGPAEFVDQDQLAAAARTDVQDVTLRLSQEGLEPGIRYKVHVNGVPLTTFELSSYDA
ncbi:hypothetical protein CO046_01000 [Candidatus Peregrinibacteria bacterium CG_4_9_14_0_2_um_filter_53_11]|nr:MAG: hypothetical protein CO046_01000 [Candidatus Peregrinibacteria bacterium CG_4_9_14_0_2_um_filter_53_11]